MTDGQLAIILKKKDQIALLYHITSWNLWITSMRVLTIQALIFTKFFTTNIQIQIYSYTNANIQIIFRPQLQIVMTFQHNSQVQHTRTNTHTSGPLDGTSMNKECAAVDAVGSMSPL